MKNLTIKTESIEIKVIRIGNCKMTMATFRQILTEKETYISNGCVLGWVNVDGQACLLANIGGELKKRWIKDLYYYGDCQRGKIKNASIIENSYDQLFIAT